MNAPNGSEQMKKLERQRATERQVELGQFPNCAFVLHRGDCIQGAIAYISEKEK